MEPDATFDLQPALCGALVRLRPLRAEDFPALYAVASDPKIWEQHPEPDRCTHAVFTRFFREALESQSALLAEDVRDGRVIGSSRYHHHDAGRREVEIGWTFLARSHWGGTYNHEMKQLMLQHAFRFVGRVLFVIGPDNERSQRAVANIGATFLEARVVDGADRVIYAIAAADFERGLGTRRFASLPD